MQQKKRKKTVMEKYGQGGHFISKVKGRISGTKNKKPSDCMRDNIQTNTSCKFKLNLHLNQHFLKLEIYFHNDAFRAGVSSALASMTYCF